LTGVFLSTLLFLYRTMRPNWWLLSRASDGEYRRIDDWNLQACRHVAVLAFNRSILFANVDQFEDVIEGLIRSMPGLRHLLIVGYAVNELDASGEIGLSIMVTTLRESGVDVSFCGLNDHVLEVMERTGLYEKIGEDHMYSSVGGAIEDIHRGRCLETAIACPLVDPAGFERYEQNLAQAEQESSKATPGAQHHFADQEVSDTAGQPR
jgi:MFS superfamily sulfate permease-like transporter